MAKMDVSTYIMQLKVKNPPLHPSTISSSSEFEKAWNHLLQFPAHSHQTSITNLNHKFNLLNVFVLFRIITNQVGILRIDNIASCAITWA